MAEGRELKDGTKNDEEKNRLELMPYDALWEIGKVYTFGARKYDPNNWAKGIKFTRVFGALMRHCWAWYYGEDNDKETGLNHMVHAAWNAITLIAYTIRGMKEWDDRPRDMARMPIEYVAGIIDGEGTVSLTFPRRSKGDITSITTIVRVGSTDLDLVNKLYTQFGGKIYSKYTRNPKHKQAQEWVLTGLVALDFLKVIYPFLRLKKRNAEILFELQSIKDTGERDKEDHRFLSKEAKDRRDELAEELKALNRRGILQ